MEYESNSQGSEFNCLSIVKPVGVCMKYPLLSHDQFIVIFFSKGLATKFKS
jgi:hypothetical protein